MTICVGRNQEDMTCFLILGEKEGGQYDWQVLSVFPHLPERECLQQWTRAVWDSTMCVIPLRTGATGI